MKSINRLAISVTPRDPYWAWARSIDDDSSIVDESLDASTSVYLIDANDDFEQGQVIRRHFATIFEEQLSSWHQDETKWPQRRTVAMFSEWFDAKVVDMVWDLGRGPIEVDE